MPRFVRFFSTVSLFALLGFSHGCSDECSGARDCDSDQVCFKRVCTPGHSARLTCTSNADCNEGGAADTLECIGGTCRITGIGAVPDSGVPPDSGMGPVDSGAGPNDSGAGPVDTGMGPADTGVADTGTSTVADAG